MLIVSPAYFLLVVLASPQQFYLILYHRKPLVPLVHIRNVLTSRLQRDLPVYNEWWQSGNPPDPDDSLYRESRRSDYENHLTCVQEEPFYAIVGADGSGKTATLYQIVHDLITDHDVDPNHVVYVPLENPLYALESEQFILDIFEWYTSYIRRQTSDNQPTYLLFDDIHQLDDWADQIRELLSNSEQIHVAVTLPTEVNQIGELEEEISGSRSVLLPPKFHDFAGTEAGLPDIDKHECIYPIRKGIAADRGVDLPTLVDNCLTLQEFLTTEYDDLASVVDEYLFNSGLRDESGQGLVTVKQRLQLALYKDIQQFHAIEEAKDLFTLCVLVAQEPVQEYQFSRLTEQLNTDRRTIRKYLTILQEFFILSPSYKWGYERHRTLRMYLRDPRYVGALNLLSGAESAFQTEDYRDNLVHSVAYDHLRRLTFYLNDYTDVEMPVRYWKEANEIVEFVLDVGGNPVPVALSTRRGEDAAAQALTDCLEDTEASRGVVAGENIRQPYAVDDGILRLPLWMLLYIC